MSTAGFLELQEASEPSTPATDLHRIYIDTTDDKAKHKRPDGVVVSLEDGNGTVTSVAVVVPVEFSVSGSPVTTSGTITISKANQNANNVYAGPATGAATTPTFRSLVTDDIPNLDFSKVTTGTVPVARGGTNSTTALNNNRVIQSFAGAIVESPAITAHKALASDTNGIPVATATTDTELGYVSGVTSAIQTQLNAKQPLDSTLTSLAAFNTNGLVVQTAADTFVGRTIIAGSSKVSISNGDGVAGNPSIDITEANISLNNLGGAPLNISKGGTNSTTALNNNRVIVSSGGSIVENTAITANRALISDTNGLPTQSTVTNTELAFVSGVTSSIQTQLNGKQATGNYITDLTGDVTASGPGSAVATIAAGAITNAKVNAAAAIAYSKLNLSGSIINADVNTSAAIAYSKLNLSNSIVNTDVNASAAISYSKLNLTNSIANADVITGAAIAYSKLNLTSSIVNTDINASAAIDASKLANGSVSNTEFQYLDGVTSAIQTQLDGKQATGNYITSLTGDVTGSGPGATATTIAAGAITNAKVNASAAIAYSKLNLSGNIVNADINPSAAIAYSKLNLTGSIVNADINASAAIDRSKIADGSAIGPNNLDGFADTLTIKDVSAVTYNKIILKDLIPSLNLKYHMVISEDFFNADTSSSSGIIGINAGTGSGTTALSPIDNVHLGLISLTTGTTTTGRAAVWQNTGGILFGNGQFSFESCIYIPTLSDGTDTYSLRIGTGDSSTGTEHTDGVFFRYSSAENSGNWVLVCRNNNVETVTNTSTAVTAGAFHTLSFVVNAAGTSVQFFLNGTSLGTNTTNIPVGVGREFGINNKIIKSAGTTTRSVTVDYINAYQSLTTAR